MALIQVITTIVALIPGGGEAVTGFLSQYDQGPTDGTLHYRMYESGEIDPSIPYDGFIAVGNCDLIGQEAWLRVAFDDYMSDWLHVVAFDCSGHQSTTDWMNEANILGEVDYYTARDHGFLDRGNVAGELVWITEGE